MKKLSVSKRGENAPASPIRKLVPFADKAEKEGAKIYHLNIGQPDLKVPESVKKRIASCTLDYLPYDNSCGMSAFIDAWLDYYHQIKIDFEKKDMLITTGASEALGFAFAAICDPGDEILVFEPFYANYAGFASYLSAKVVPVVLDADNGYHLPKRELIEEKITDHTRAILLTNPNNPTGTVFAREEIQLILDIAIKHDLFIITDETYYGITFGENKSISLFHVAPRSEWDRIIMIDSVSKRLNVCGARIGLLATTNSEIMSIAVRFAQARLSVGTLDQWILLDALQDSVSYVRELAQKYEKRRDAFINAFEQASNIKVSRPEGAFYTQIKLPIEDADAFAEWLLTDFRLKGETVMVAPGSGFYLTEGMGKDEIRVAYVLEEGELEKAALILSEAIKSYKSK